MKPMPKIVVIFNIRITFWFAEDFPLGKGWIVSKLFFLSVVVFIKPQDKFVQYVCKLIVHFWSVAGNQ